MGKDILLVAVIAVILFAIVFGIGYSIYRKIGKGKKRINMKILLWGSIFVCYILVVLFGTLLSRDSYMGGDIILSPLYSYKEAWVNASAAAWGLIIVNIMLFVPFGFLLPLGSKKFQPFWKTYLAGFLFSVCIELMQLIFHFGVFETADLLNNTIGVFIGYGLYKIIAFFMSVKIKEKLPIKKTILFQIPLFLCIAGFGGTYIVYQMQELGNVPAYILSKNKKDFTIHSTETYDTKEASGMVYKIQGYTKEEAKQYAVTVFDKLHTKVNEDYVDVYDDCIIYKDIEGKYDIWIYFKNGNYNITNWDAKKEENKPDTTVSREKIEKKLSQYGISLPKGSSIDVGENHHNYIFKANKIKIGDTLYDGELYCTYYENGEFDFYGKDLIIDVGEVHMEYRQDTKGYYQPVYVFDVKSNVEYGADQIAVSAIKK